MVEATSISAWLRSSFPMLDSAYRQNDDCDKSLETQERRDHGSLTELLSRVATAMANGSCGDSSNVCGAGRILRNDWKEWYPGLCKLSLGIINQPVDHGRWGSDAIWIASESKPRMSIVVHNGNNSVDDGNVDRSIYSDRFSSPQFSTLAPMVTINHLIDRQVFDYGAMENEVIRQEGPLCRIIVIVPHDGSVCHTFPCSICAASTIQMYFNQVLARLQFWSLPKRLRAALTDTL
jgi:hypothetical protein